MYNIVVTWARVISLIYTHDNRGRAAPEGKCGYISAKSQERMLQLLCDMPPSNIL